MNIRFSFMRTLALLVIVVLIMLGVYTDFSRLGGSVVSKLSSASSTIVTGISNNAFERGGGSAVELSDVDVSQPTLVSFLAPPAKTLPERDWSVLPPELSAQSVYVVDAQTQTVLLAKNETAQRSIASLTKLMTAYVASRRIPPASDIVISREAVATEGKAGDLVAGESLSFYDTLAALLLPSSNDAAEALAQAVGRDMFVSLMNEETHTFGISDTAFKNPSGLDEEGQYSSAKSVVEIFRRVYEIEPLRQVLSEAVHEARSRDEKIFHRFLTSNWLLGSYPGVIGGKTGFTDEAGQSLIIAWQPPESALIERKDSAPVVFAVVLGSQDRFGDMRTVLNWLVKAYHW